MREHHSTGLKPKANGWAGHRGTALRGRPPERWQGKKRGEGLRRAGQRAGVCRDGALGDTKAAPYEFCMMAVAPAVLPVVADTQPGIISMEMTFWTIFWFREPQNSTLPFT